jgi:hypothetical protein
MNFNINITGFEEGKTFVNVASKEKHLAAVGIAAFELLPGEVLDPTKHKPYFAAMIGKIFIVLFTYII